MRREDDYQARREHLAGLTDEQLYDKFWGLIGEIVDPLLEMGKEYTRPSIERSVLLRRGISSIEAKALSVREAGIELAAGKLWDDAVALF